MRMGEMLRAVAHQPGPASGVPFDVIPLRHDERRVRRKLLRLVHGDEVLVDFPQPVTLEHGAILVLEDGRSVEVIASEEDLYEVRGRDSVHLMQICWHLGNRHLPTQIEQEWEGLGLRVLIARDHVIKQMLLGLGATVSEVSEPFSPVQGAYHQHKHALLSR